MKYIYILIYMHIRKLPAARYVPQLNSFSKQIMEVENGSFWRLNSSFQVLVYTSMIVGGGVPFCQ